jgi:hypothetical protein
MIDELGYMELDRRGAELLFHVLTEREERNSIAIASNQSFSGWTRLSRGSWDLRWGPPPEREHATLRGPPSPRRRTPDARLAHARPDRRKR